VSSRVIRHTQHQTVTTQRTSIHTIAQCRPVLSSFASSSPFFSLWHLPLQLAPTAPSIRRGRRAFTRAQPQEDPTPVRAFTRTFAGSPSPEGGGRLSPPEIQGHPARYTHGIGKQLCANVMAAPLEARVEALFAAPLRAGAWPFYI
jgi:hypothetical protein